MMSVIGADDIIVSRFSSLSGALTLVRASFLPGFLPLETGDFFIPSAGVRVWTGGVYAQTLICVKRKNKTPRHARGLCWVEQ